MNRFSGKKVAVVGLSTEGQDSVAFMLSQGAEVHCYDRRTSEELGPLYTQLVRLPVTFHLGTEYLNDVHTCDIIIRTPGMSLNTLQLQRAKQKGKELTSLTKLFMELCPCPIIGVSGTKGKGTTCMLMYEMLKASGAEVYLGGNIGMPLLSRVQSIPPSAQVVLELSSFQLEDVTQSPHIAVLLNITSEHLANFDQNATNFHASTEEYRAAKKNLVKFQTADDFCVLNHDDPQSLAAQSETKARTFYYSTKQMVTGCYVRDDKIIVRYDDRQEIICSTDEIKLLGVHNRENICAAVLAASLAAVEPAAIRKVVTTYGGFEHRLEFVSKNSDIEYYNDSAATIPDATIAAIAAINKPLVLIAGGSDKGADFTALGEKIVASHVKAVVLIGQMAEKIATAIHNAAEQQKKPLPQLLTGAKNMQEIMKQARSVAQAGDAILLSPACASFGMFTNYKERGTLFKKYAQTRTA